MSNVIDNDKGFRNLLFSLAGVDGAEVRIGVFADKKASRTEGELPNAVVAAFHEFGTKDLRKRPFLRPSIKQQQREIFVLAEKLAGLMYDGRMGAKRALDILGLKVSTGVKNYIREGKVRPKLKKSTIAAKGSDVPLLDTGQLINSITWKVVTGIVT